MPDQQVTININFKNSSKQGRKRPLDTPERKIERQREERDKERQRDRERERDNKK